MPIKPMSDVRISALMQNKERRMARRTTRELMLAALRAETAIPGFNIPYLPMMEPVIRALRDTRSVGLITVARLEWEKFESRSL